MHVGKGAKQSRYIRYKQFNCLRSAYFDKPGKNREFILFFIK
jgi:hypothetical protein